MKKKNRLFQLTLCVLLLSLFAAQFAGCGLFPNEKKSRALFIYLCGSNLETKNGAASKNLDELLQASISDDTYIVIETGGAAEWQSHGIKNNVLSRYEIRNGKLKRVGTRKNASMGEEETLADFLSWGQKKYPSDHSMLVLWDHGSGPVNGVCFDENYRMDPLTLTELKNAFESAGLTKKFDIIGFDACLMANLETAAVLEDHADYMVASQEIEPPGGWDYKALAEAFDAGLDSIETGKRICDSYMEKSAAAGKDNYATLSVYDLSLMPEMSAWFQKAMGNVEGFLLDKEYSHEIIQALRNCDRFGGNNSYLGRSNLIDLISIFDNTPSIPGDLTGLWEIVGRFVPYNVHGDAHSGKGASFFYPVLYDKNEIEEYVGLGIFEEYNRFLRDYYLDTPEKTVEFADRGSKRPNGDFGITLTEDSLAYLASIDFLLMTKDEGGELQILFTDNDITTDPDKLNYESGFRGRSPALEGHRLFSVTNLRNEYFASFSSPIMVNGERTTLLYDWMELSMEDQNMGACFIPTGLWDGYDENGLPDSEIEQLQKGDRVQVVTGVTYENGDAVENWSEEFTITEEDDFLAWEPIEEREYQYVFIVKDVFGNTFVSDMAAFRLAEDHSFEVYDIEPYTMGYLPEK